MTRKGSPKPKRTWGQRLRRLALFGAASLVVLLVLTVAASMFAEWYCEPVPPSMEMPSHLASMTVVEDGEYRRFGDCYLRRKDGILRMRLTGTPYELGYANAVLTQAYIRDQEAALIATVKQFIPSDVAFWLIRKLVVVRNRNLPDFVPMDRQIEILGLSHGYEDPFPHLGGLYGRMLNYHAAHDISHAVMHNPLVGCTSFAAWGTATADGHLFMGRNFDFSAGREFDENKIVIRFEPDEGLGFISVAWPGMTGVVTGMNDARIAVSINACYSYETQTIGTPVSIMLREVMEGATTLDEAAEIIRGTEVFVADTYLVADGKTGKAIVVEKTPGHTEIRRPESDSVVCANHFLTPALEDHPGNQEYKIEGTTMPRFDRTRELVDARHGTLALESAAEILRDSLLPGGRPAGMGNDAVVNCYMATHSVIMDVTAGVVWVAASPHQLGAYVPFGLVDLENPGNTAVVPSDPALANGSYARFVESETLITQANRLMDDGAKAEAVKALEKARELNPGYYVPPMLLGTLAAQAGRRDEAEAMLNEALAAYPAYGSERDEIRELLRGVTGAASGDGS
ncbi:MAG: hypothetical protein GY851_01050 [bacterium]|nr:hypothetical protein [bacterium]